MPITLFVCEVFCGEGFILAPAVGRFTELMWVGELRKAAAIQRWGGRTPTSNRKICGHGRPQIFLPLEERPRGATSPSPFERLMKGLWGSAKRGGTNPTDVSRKWGKPRGEGEGQYRPPLYCRRSTMSVMGRREARVGCYAMNAPHGYMHHEYWPLCRINVALNISVIQLNAILFWQICSKLTAVVTAISRKLAIHGVTK
jgi:hypothetical protein